MSDSRLPERASLEYLKKLAKDRLREQRQADPHTKLAAALLAVAQEHGFSSWRVLKAEVEKKQRENDAVFFEACAKGDVEALRALIAGDPSLVRATDPSASHGGWTGLHTAAQRGHIDVVRLLLAHEADPNAREDGDNTYPLHWAAAQRYADIVRLLLDAGGDVNGLGDVHELDAIGWASLYEAKDRAPGGAQDVVALLVERGARHHIFSAIVTGDFDLIQRLVEQNPEALDRRMSRFEQGQTALHFAINRKRYDILDLLIQLGADVESRDSNGLTALETAMLRGDHEATTHLIAAGAKQPAVQKVADSSAFRESMAKLAGSVRHSISMIKVPDVERTLMWYASIGFKEIARHEDDGIVNWGLVSFGKSEIMLSLDGTAGPHDVTLWFYTDQVDKLYELLKSRQFESAMGGDLEQTSGIEFVQHIYDPFYGGREFGVRDLNGYELYFRQPAEW